MSAFSIVYNEVVDAVNGVSAILKSGSAKIKNGSAKIEIGIDTEITSPIWVFP